MASGGILSHGFELIKQYKGDEQVRLKVIVEIPGSWFGGGAQGSLTAPLSARRSLRRRRSSLFLC